MSCKIFRRFSLVLLLTALSAIGFAQQPARQLTPSVERLRQHVTYLASDALEGRRTGTPGANDAAHYIAGEFQRLGLKPGSPVARGTRLKGEMLARYQQRFPYIAGVSLGKHNLLSFDPKRSENIGQSVAGEDWMPLGISSNGQVARTEYVFVGYGITASELKHDDYGARAKGRIAVALAGTPDGDNPHGQFARYEGVRWKAIAARNAGAAALLVITQEEKFQDDPLARLQYDNSGGEAGLPVAVISRQMVARMFPEHGDVQSVLAILQKAAQDPQALGGQPRGGVTLNLFTEIVRQEVAATNVIGILEGSDPKLKDEAIVIGAHYDHLGRGGEGSLAPRPGEIHHGADDNASGVAGLLELARLFSNRPKPKRTIVFIGFSGEEEGLLGSNYYVNHPVIPLANTVAMVNMDMIGRMKENNLTIGGVGTAPEWRQLIEASNFLQGLQVALTASIVDANPNAYPIVVASNGQPVVSLERGKKFQLSLSEDGFGPSDHSSFYAKQIPVLFFFTGSHEDYHKPSDTADKINYEGESQIVALVARMVQEVDRNEKRPSYAKAKSDSAGRASGFRVYLGTIPNYGDAKDGLLLDGVRDDSPAAEAGLKAGDKIVKLAGRDVRNVYDYTYALGEMKAGQEYEIEIMRGSERLTLKLTPAARK